MNLGAGLLLLRLFKVERLHLFEYLVYSFGLGLAAISFVGWFLSVTMPGLAPINSLMMYVIFGIEAVLVGLCNVKHWRVVRITWPTRREWIVLAVIIAVGTINPLIYSLNNADGILFWGDTSRAHVVYTGTLDDGFWSPGRSELLDSCLTTTLYPAMITRLTGGNPYSVLLYLPVMYAVFALLACYVFIRRFVGMFAAVMATAMISASFYIDMAASMSRLIVAFIYMVAVLSVVYSNITGKKKYALMGLLVYGLVISHYGTAAFTMFLLAGSVVISLAYCKDTRLYLVPLVMLLLFSLAWYLLGLSHDGMIGRPAAYIWAFINRSFDGVSSIGNINSMEPVAQQFLGFEITQQPQVIKIFATWCVSIISGISLIYCAVVDRRNPGPLPLAITGIILIIATLLIPYISVHYGLYRVIFSAMPFMAIYFVMVFKRLHWIYLLIPTVIVWIVL